MHASQNLPIRLLIVEHQPTIATDLRAGLGREPGFSIVGQRGSIDEATRALSTEPIDMVLIESTLPEPGAIEMARSVRALWPRTVLIFVTRTESPAELFEAARAGAAAYVRSSTAADVGLAVLRRAAAGEFPIDEDIVACPAVVARLLAQFRGHSALADDNLPQAQAARVEPAVGGSVGAKLSARELRILDLVARGNSNKLIGRTLSISDQTVKNHVSAILRKLEVKDRTEAVVYALRNGWIRMEANTS